MESDIKKAYRKAALKHHPDKVGLYLARTNSGDDGVRSWKDIVEKFHVDADRLFKMISETYAIFSDPNKVADNYYKHDLKKAAFARLSVVHRSLKVAKFGVKRRNRQA